MASELPLFIKNTEKEKSFLDKCTKYIEVSINEVVLGFILEHENWNTQFNSKSQKYCLSIEIPYFSTVTASEFKLNFFKRIPDLRRSMNFSMNEIQNMAPECIYSIYGIKVEHSTYLDPLLKVQFGLTFYLYQQIEEH